MQNPEDLAKWDIAKTEGWSIGGFPGVYVEDIPITQYAQP